MRAERARTALPYAVIFAVAAWFYRLAGEIEFTRRADYPGPDFWPRIALAAMMIICAVQFARLLFFGRPDQETGVIDTSDGAEEEGPRSTVLLLAGVVLTVAYGFVMPILGFLISTFLFLILFIYAGRYRSPVPILLTSLIGSVGALILFQKVVYVSLPRGIPPFDGLADMILRQF